MLTCLKEDVVYDGIAYLGFVNAPAAKANHHACEGGLVSHILEMWNIHENMDLSLFNKDPLITPRTVLAGIVLHDLHKGWCHFVRDASVSSGVNYGKHPSSNLLTADQKTVYIASQYVTLDMVQLNAVYHSEGGWASSPPKWASVLSKYLYLLDELSSNLRDRTIDVTTLPHGVVHVFGDKGVTTKLSPGFEIE